MNKYKQFSKSDLPIKSDGHFWIIKHSPKGHSSEWTKIVRYEGDLLKEALQKKHPDFEHYPNVYRIDNFYFYQAEKIQKDLIIKKINVYDHPSSAFIFESLVNRFLSSHLE